MKVREVTKSGWEDKGDRGGSDVWKGGWAGGFILQFVDGRSEVRWEGRAESDDGVEEEGWKRERKAERIAAQRKGKRRDREKEKERNG